MCALREACHVMGHRFSPLSSDTQTQHREGTRWPGDGMLGHTRTLPSTHAMWLTQLIAVYRVRPGG